MKKVTNKRENEKHITHVKVDGVEKTRKEVIDDLSKNDYFTYPDGLDGRMGAKIHKTSNGWITTNPNDNNRDNLDNLKSF